jgi:hypothetical protein
VRYLVFQFGLDSQRRVPYPDWVIPITCGGRTSAHPDDYGERIRDTWRQYGDGRGMVVLEHDIAVDLRHWRELEEAIDFEPRFVHAVPFVLWRASTQSEHEFWSHAVFDSVIEHRLVPITEPCPSALYAFPLGCTWLPARLLDHIDLKRGNWEWPCVDAALSRLARSLSISAQSTATPAVHLHYD